MNNPAAFSATFADWKLIKTRKCVQIVFEVPLEAADAAYQVLGGMPDPSTSVWFGIAKLQQPKGGDPTADHGHARTPGLDTAPRQETKTGGARKWDELPYSQQAALACNDAIFRAFLREGCRYPGAVDAGTAAVAVRLHCGVDSRSELDADPDARGNWQKMYARYGEWKLNDRVSA